MQFTASTIALVATTLLLPSTQAGPLPDAGLEAKAPILRKWTSPDNTLHVSGVGYQGDGFYSATFNASGHAEVVFTPAAKFATREALEVSQNAVESRDHLLKRDTTCIGRWPSNFNDAYNGGDKLSHTVDKNFEDNHWGWWFTGGEVAYYCVYKSQYVPAKLVQDMQYVVRDRCKGKQNGVPWTYGYDHRKNGGGALNFATGYTYKGDHFCTGSFTG